MIFKASIALGDCLKLFYEKLAINATDMQSTLCEWDDFGRIFSHSLQWKNRHSWGKTCTFDHFFAYRRQKTFVQQTFWINKSWRGQYFNYFRTIKWLFMTSSGLLRNNLQIRIKILYSQFVKSEENSYSSKWVTGLHFYGIIHF